MSHKQSKAKNNQQLKAQNEQINQMEKEVRDQITQYVEGIKNKLLNKSSPKITKQQFTDLHSLIYQLTTKDEDKALQILIKCDHITVQVMEEDERTIMWKESEQSQALDALEKFIQRFYILRVMTRWLVGIFLPLKLKLQGFQQMTIAQTVLEAFKSRYFDHHSKTLANNLLSVLDQHRKQKTTPPYSVKEVLKLFCIVDVKDLDVRKNELSGEYEFESLSNVFSKDTFVRLIETELIRRIEEYYSSQIVQIMSVSVGEIIQVTLEGINYEENLAKNYYKQSLNLITKALNRVLVKEFGSNLISRVESGFNFMLENRLIDQLKNTYQFCKRDRGLIQQAARMFQEFIFRKGIILNKSFETQQNQQRSPSKNPNNQDGFMDEFFRLMEEFDFMVKDIFEDNLFFQSAETVAFSNILNQQEKIPILLAIQCDILCKSYNSDEEIFTKKLLQILRVISLIYQRDVFFKHYTKFLTQRLLSIRRNIEIEERFLIKFKTVSGVTQIEKIQSMINDIKISEAQIERLEQKDFKQLILTWGFWPVDIQESQIIIKDSMKSLLSAKEQDYNKQYQDRVLVWVYNQGVGEVSFNTDKKYVIQLSTIQIILFLLFNDQEQWSVADIIKATNITRNQIDINLIPLVAGGVLKRQLANLDEFKGDELLTLNVEFQHQQRKIKMLPNPKLIPQKNKNDSAETSRLKEEIEKEREIITDSIIVRLMKSRREMKHSVLCEECLKIITQFKPTSQFLKTRIESLVEREYLNRSSDFSIYRYNQ